nr:hypothetical protein [Halorhabdus rudnickae]
MFLICDRILAMEPVEEYEERGHEDVQHELVIELDGYLDDLRGGPRGDESETQEEEGTTNSATTALMKIIRLITAVKVVP